MTIRVTVVVMDRDRKKEMVIKRGYLKNTVDIFMGDKEISVYSPEILEAIRAATEQ